jgi:hypothetical protein
MMLLSELYDVHHRIRSLMLFVSVREPSHSFCAHLELVFV